MRRVSELNARWAAEGGAQGREMTISQALGAAARGLDEFGLFAEGDCRDTFQAR